MKRQVLILFILSAILVVLNAACPHEDTLLKKWSEESTWTSFGLDIPEEDSLVTIPTGLHVLMDVANPPKLSGITIENNASLVWDLKPIELSVSHIMVKGLLQIGSEDCPFDQKTVITLEDETESADTRVGVKVIGVLEGGALLMFGKVHSPVWTRLDGTVASGSNTIKVIDEVEWQVGEKIVIAPTNYDPNESEVFTIQEIASDKKTITLSSSLKYEHFGVAPESNNGFEERAEVALLDRYIKLQGNEASDKDGFGGHTMCIANYDRANFVGVEFTRMGQRGVLARYPVHYHVVQYGRFLVKDNSMHYNYQRCVTLHSSSNLHVINNMCYDVEGHAMFIEDGYDTGAILENNLVIHVKEGTLQPHDRVASSGFFLTGPNNTIIGNQVSGAHGHGYWYSAPKELIGPSHTEYAAASPYRTVLGVFEGNNARTLKQTGLFVDLGADMNNNPVVLGYDPRENALDEQSDPVLAKFANFQVTKCQQYGIHTRGGFHEISNAKIASCFGGVRFANAPFATARQTMTGGIIYRTTNNAATSIPNSSGALAGLPQRAIVPFGGPNTFSGVTMKGFTLPAGACVAPYGNEPLSVDSTLKNIDCSGQSLLYVASKDQLQTDNDKMFAQRLQTGESISELVASNEFMRMPSPQCTKLSDYALKCNTGTHATVVIRDEDYTSTAYPSGLSANDTHAYVYRFDANYKTEKAQIEIVGANDDSTTSTKKNVYGLNLPVSSTDAYGVVFKYHTPPKLQISVDQMQSASSYTSLAFCYPDDTTITGITRNDGVQLTRASSTSELNQNRGSMYHYDEESGRLTVPVVFKQQQQPTTYSIRASLGSTDVVNCFDTTLPRVSSSASVSKMSIALSLVVIALVAIYYKL